jgi:anti-sigma factor RsiW
MSEPADDDLTCRELVEVITDYFEGVMSDADRARLERHLRDSSGCQAVVSQFRTTIEVTRRLTEDQVSDDQRAAIRDVFRRWREAPSGSS